MEKRSFSRVQTRITALARRCDSLDDPLLFKSGPPAGGHDWLAEAAKSGTVHQALIDFLESMDRKLDLLLATLNRERLEKDFPLHLDVREISGAGLRFLARDDIKDNDILEVVMFLGQNPPRMAGAKGKVQAARTLAGTFGFEFVKIRQSDQDAVVQFVFQEEREQIRDSKRA